jgi:hypothetical protein
MKKQSKQAIEQGKETVALQASSHLAASQLTDQMVEGLKLLGAVQAGLNISRSVSARLVRVLQEFIEAKAYEAFGRDTLTDFLNNSPHSPMSKNQYYERLEILDKEGDATFGLLNNLRIPVSARKLLSDGTVRIEGDVIRIGDETIPVSDGSRVKDVIRTLAEATAEQKQTIVRSQKEVTKLKKELDTAKQSGATGNSPFEHALLNLLGAFTALISEVEKLPADEIEDVRSTMFIQLTNQRLRLEEAFGMAAPHGNGNGFHLSDERMDEISDAL